MAFREKIAWLSLAAMAIAYGIYFSLAVHAAARGTASTLSLTGLLGAVLACQALVVLIASVAIAIASGRDASAPADERDRAIARRGAAIAYFVLMAGVILVGCVMPFSHHGWEIVNAALLALVTAEIVRYGAIVLSYRRGWHG